MTRKNQSNDEEPLKMTLIDHLAEFRKRLMFCGVFFLIFSIAAYFYIQPLTSEMLDTARDFNFVYLSPSELFLIYIRLSLLAGFFLSLPVIVFNIWGFIAPALDKFEKVYILVCLICGTLFFVLGAAFSFKVILPIVIRFFVGLSMQDVDAMISVSNYVGFVTSLMVCFGLVFEMPVVMLVLTSLGVVKVDVFKKNRKYVVLICLVVAAILTPPDVVSQVLMAIPMVILFEFGIIICTWLTPKKFRETNK